MTEEEKLLIGELAKKAGVSTRTIRYYIQEGLLPPPATRGRYTIYDEDYLKRIQLINLLKENFLPLKEIRLIMDMLDPQNLDLALQKYAAGAGQGHQSPIIKEFESSDSAAEYVHRVIESRRGGGRIAESAPRHIPPPGVPRPEPKTAPPPSKGDKWVRFDLSDGVELHVIDGKIDENNLEQLLQEIRNKLKHS